MTTLPDAKSLCGSFPFKMSHSIKMGVNKVFPAFMKFVGQNKAKYPKAFSKEEKSAVIEYRDEHRPFIDFFYPTENLKAF